MPVEKMEMINVLGPIEDRDTVSEEMVKCGCIHLVSVMEEIKNIQGDNEEVKRIFQSNKNTEEYQKIKEQVEGIMDALHMDKYVSKNYLEENMNLGEISNKIDGICKDTLRAKHMLDRSKEDLGRIIELTENVKSIKELRFALSELKNLKFFIFRIGRLGKNYYIKLKENIENIPSIIYKISTSRDYVTVVIFTPRSSENEASEILKSLRFEEIVFPESIKGLPINVLQRLEGLITELESRVKRLEGDLLSIRKRHEEFINKSFSLIQKSIKSRQIENEMAFTRYAFCVSGWIPASAKKGLMKRLKRLEQKIVITFTDAEQVKSSVPPTRLINNRFAKPFEYIVKMYGIPSYSEADPTFFVAVSYLIMFGAMFGDVGQGILLLCGGLFLTFVKKAYEFGGILSRVGASSMFFGFLYGSIFGNEKIIHPLLINPMENINTVLAGGVVFGIVLSIISYIYSLINSARLGELEDGLFGREGAAGFLFYIIALLAFFWRYRYGDFMLPAAAVAAILLILLALMVLKQPLTRFLEGKRPLHRESLGDYYVESIFGVLETLLGMLSKTISFVRLGAFALNHAGLFIAFATVAEMVNNRAAGIAVLVLGNIIIIGLEGLVVFIQGLRLEYYELFSRFYKGEGMEYDPVNLLYRDSDKDNVFENAK